MILLGKIFLIIILVIVSLFVLIVGIDLRMGYSLHSSIYKTINPFKVMEMPELLTLLVLIFSYLFRQIALFIKRYLKARNN